MKMASCHPNKRAYGFGLCNSCYRRQKYANDPNYREICRIAARNCRARNLEKYKNSARLHYQTHRDRIKLSARLSHHGITLEFYNEMLARQNGACAICEGQFASATTTHIDHCHGTGIVRGILCHKCNTGIGWMEKNPRLLSKVFSYIEPTSQQLVNKH